MLGWSRLPASSTSRCLPPPACAGWVYFGAGALGGWQMGDQVSKKQEQAPSYSCSMPARSFSILALPQAMGTPRVGLCPCPAPEVELGCLGFTIPRKERQSMRASLAGRQTCSGLSSQEYSWVFQPTTVSYKRNKSCLKEDRPWGETQQPPRVTWARSSPITSRLGCPSLKPNFIFLCWQNTAISSSSAPTDIPHPPRLEIHRAHNRTVIAIFHILLIVFFSHTSVMFNKSLLNLTAVVCQKHRHSISHISSTLE